MAGAAADDIGMQCGGWTVDWQGDHNSNADFPGATSIFAGIQAAVMRSGGSAVSSRDGEFTRKPDVAIVVFGEGPYAEFEGDRETLEFSPEDKSALSMLRYFRALGIPTVSVFLSGRPLWVNPEINASDAFIAAWLPGTEGGGIADVLFRAQDGSVPYGFTGRLAFSWPNSAMPVTFDAAGRVKGALFATGFGLDYGAHSVSPGLSEDPQIAPHFHAPLGSLFFDAHPTAPWSLFVADGNAEVHVTTARQDSPHGAVRAQLETAGARVSWSGTGRGALRISGRAADLGSESNRSKAIRLRFRVDQPPAAAVVMGILCTDPLCGTANGAMLDVTRTFRAAAVGAWLEVEFPLSCLKAAGADLSGVLAPLALATAGRFELTIAQVRLMQAARTTACPPAPGPVG